MRAKQILFLHIFYWILNLSFSIVTPIIAGKTGFFVLSVTFFAVSFIAFYINYFYIVPFFFNIKKLYFTIFGFFVSVGCFVFFRYMVEELILPLFIGHGNYAEGTSLLYYYYDNVFYSSTTLFISTVLSLFNIFFKREEERQTLIEEKKYAELKALKTQINPHFIFNSLNNIYSLVFQNSEKALPAIEELSKLLRYSTKDLEQDFIPLEREIGYVKSLIELEKLRIKNPEKIIISNHIKNPALKISPMLIVPFVENAFKHGDFRDKGFEMNISDENKILHFYLLNYKKEKMKDSVSGIGIDNVRKRLDILYPKKHELKITETEADFTIDLKIDLKNEEN
ncbi:sensor histidine kinase [Chryseobacterium sp. 2R14A]|uniref:sensor histidine kinase n=1 Tax=Chryseobacterium sp. 2R14A TaxID=3380353 RepID=UPI003CE8C012